MRNVSENSYSATFRVLRACEVCFFLNFKKISTFNAIGTIIYPPVEVCQESEVVPLVTIAPTLQTSMLVIVKRKS